MSTHRRYLVLVGVILIGTVAALLMHDHLTPVAGLSRNDVIEIRGAVLQSLACSSFKTWNLRDWPFFLRMRFSFHVKEIIQDARDKSIRRVTIHADGTREEPNQVMRVRFRADGWWCDTCLVERKNGRWIVMPPTAEIPELLLLPCHFPNLADAGLAPGERSAAIIVDIYEERTG
jgi:hypothetical protein